MTDVITLTEAEMVVYKRMMYEARDAAMAFDAQFPPNTRSFFIRLMAIVLLKESTKTTLNDGITEVSQRLKEWVVAGQPEKLDSAEMAAKIVDRLMQTTEGGKTH